ncbi:MAG: hypothetical protein LBD69_04080 [Puniceicoccales bacterium]|jgi:hypothetical protein|nr:hypothetical protein [Puniceicoccales bacterium]
MIYMSLLRYLRGAFLVFVYFFSLDLSGKMIAVGDIFDVTSQKLSPAALLTIPEICEVFATRPKELLTPTDRTLQLLTQAFNELQRLENGKIIINKLYALITEKRIKIKEGGSISVGIENGIPYIKGIHELANPKECCLLGPWDEKIRGYQVGLGKIPPCVTLGHELIHLVDGLQNTDAFINHSRSLEQWIIDNKDNQSIMKLVKMPYFKEIFLFIKEVNIYEELFVHFGTSASRNDKIPTENRLLLDAKLGLKIGYSPKSTSFFISDESVRYLTSLYNVNIKDILNMSGTKSIKFDKMCALQNSPSFFRNQGMYKTSQLSKQMSSLADFLSNHFPAQQNRQRQGRQFLEQRRQHAKLVTSFTKAYQEMAQEIDGMCQKLPYSIVQQGITLAYYYGAKVIVKFNQLVPFLEREAPKITFQLDNSQPYKIPFRPNQSEIVCDLGWIKNSPPHKIAIFLNKQQLGTLGLDSPTSSYKFGEITFDFVTNAPFLSMNSLPQLAPEAPKTVLGLIRYEQFYNKHQKLLLQVGKGTSLEETIQLHNQIYPEHRTEWDDDFVIIDIFKPATMTDVNTIAAGVASTAINFDDGVAEIITKNSISPDDFSRYLAPRKHSFVDLDGVFPTFVKSSKIDDALSARADALKAKLDAKSAIRAFANNIAKQLDVNLRLYLCDSQGREVHRPLLFPYGSPRDRGQPIEIVQDITSVPNVYFLVVDTGSLLPSPVAQKGRSVTPRKRAIPPSPSLAEAKSPAKPAPKPSPSSTTSAKRDSTPK